MSYTQELSLEGARLHRVKRSALHLWREHGAPLFLYIFLSIFLSWPMVRTFTTAIAGHSNDAFNGLWVAWHVKEALLGRQPLFDLPLLYYPAGASLLTHIPGPVIGLFALPFWSWGAEAALNGALLVSLVLTGYFMYLLARSLNFVRPVALFAGLVLLMAPMHLAGLWGHITKVYLGAIPLTLLAVHHALDGRRSLWWSLATALALLFTFLHDSFQFVLAGLALAYFALVALWGARPEERYHLVRRVSLTAGLCLLVVGPLLLATAAAALDPAIEFDNNLQSFTYQPDVVELFLPPVHSLLFGRLVDRFFRSYGVFQSIETTIGLSVVTLALSLIAVWRAGRPARTWALLTLGWVILSLGPALKILGYRHFTEYGLPIILPYALLTALPGLDFLRTSGRFMQIGYVTLGITAAYGLAWLLTRYRRWANWTVAGAVLLLAVELWPQPWPHMQLRPTPAFYRELAADPAQYGVLDLPFTSLPAIPEVVYSAHYQMYQMTHRKGIAMGYISRTYTNHPIFPCLIPEPQPPQPDILVNGRPADCLANALYDLTYFNYRYVVWHKPQPAYDDYRPGVWGAGMASGLLTRLFPDQSPLVDDSLTVVYELPPPEGTTGLTATMGLKGNWGGREDGWRWAGSPATLFISAPQPLAGVLEITPAMIHEPGPDQRVGDEGRLTLSTNDGWSTTVTIVSEQTTAVPLDLPAGVHTITLTLEAGTFRPSDYGEPDQRELAFAIRTLNLRTAR